MILGSRSPRILLYMLFVFMAPPAVRAQFTWTGAINSQWGVGANWGSAFVPPAGSNVRFGAAGNASVDLAGNRTVGVLSFDAAVPFTLSNDVLKISTGLQTNGTIVGSHEIASGVELPSAIPWSIASEAPLLVSGVIEGTGGFAKLGAGELTLSGINAFTGDTLINAGQIVLGHADALANSTVVINIDDGLDIVSNEIHANLGGLAGSGDLDLGSQELFTGLNNADTTYSGVIRGTSESAVRHKGTGTLTLTGGDEVASSDFGTLRAEGADAAVILDGAYVNLTGASTTYAEDAIVAQSGNITLQNGANVQTLQGTIAEGGALTVSGSGTSLTSDSAFVVQKGGALTVENAATVAVGGMTVGGFPGAAGNMNNVSVAGDNSQLTTDSLYLGSDSNSNNMVTATNGATLQVKGATQFATATSNTLTVDGATWETGQLAQDPGIVGTIGISDPAGGIAMTVGTNDGDSAFDGLIQDAAGGPGSLRKVGAGTLTLSNANTFTGPTIVDGGQVILANANALRNSTVNINLDHGLDVNANAVAANLGGLAGSGDLEIGQDLTVGFQNANSTYSGVLSGSGQLIKIGPGALTLTASNAHGGAVVRGGTLVIDGADRIGADGADLTLDGGRLRLAGDVNAGSARELVLELGGGVLNTNGFNANWNGIVSGAGSLEKIGDGQLNLAAANTFTGGLSLGGGTVRLADDNAAGTGVIAVLGATIDYANNVDIANEIDLQHDVTLNVNVGAAAQSGRIGETGGSFGIAKTGAGTLILTSPNAYAGDTLVEAGTLSIQHAYLSDAADVRIETGGTFNLNFMGTDTIDELFVNGHSKQIGTHGAIGSGADFEWLLFTGTGVLRVSSFAGLAGDFDADGDVDGHDLLRWQRGETLPPFSSGDLTDWQANYGRSAPTNSTSSTTTPEPTSLLLAFAAGLGCEGRRRRLSRG